MNWEVISNDRSSLKEYRLIDNNDCKVIIKYNPRHQSARVTCGNHHRLFFLESAGSLSGKTIFRNEYGMGIGNLVHDKFHPQEGSLVIDNLKYKYQLKNNAAPELYIYENGNQQLFANCSIPSNKIILQNTLSVSTEAINNNCYLLGLCWYLSLSLVKEEALKYSSADY